MKYRAALAGMVVALAGCMPEGIEDDGIAFGEDTGKADEAGALPLIQTNAPFYWADSDYAAFTATWHELAGYGLPPQLADTDPLTQRLQGWVDRLDEMVRAELARSLGEELVAPTPILKIVTSGSTFNAWVSGTTACTGATLPGAVAGSSGKTLLRSTEAVHGAVTQCLRPAYPGVEEFRAFWERHQPACHVGADLTLGGAGCAIQTYAEPGELTFLATSPYVHVSTDLIATVAEPTLVVILAHELAHYYRSHVSDAKVQRYNFWYETEVDRKKLPVPSALATELRAAYAEINAGPTSVQTSTPGHYSPRLRAWLVSALAPLLRERTEAGFVCAAARDALGGWVEPLLSGYGLPTERITAYLAFERALVACAPRLELKSEGSATTLSYGSVLMAVPEAKLAGATLPFYASLADVLDALNARAVRLDDKAAALLRRVRENRIGLYTTEQEADNLALALSVKLGLSPDQVLEAWLDFMGAIAQVVPEYRRAAYAQEHATCRAHLDAEFTTVDASGARVPLFVPIGDLNEPHHSDCYRLFNFWREQKLRNYRAVRSLTFEPGWDALRAQAQQLSAQARANGQ